MEPSGLMDESHLDLSSRLAGSRTNRNDWNIYDMADEEVHFTRNPKPGYAYQYSFSTIPTQNASPRLSPQFPEISLNEGYASAEQVKSSKLLNKIGSKLRRGSNYLAAPKLVGEYLLGITIRSWSEFLNTSRMLKTPTNTQQLTRRLLNNLAYFQGNYLCVSLILIIYCILTSPLLLLAIIAYVSALYFVTAKSATGRQLNLLGFKPNLQQQYSFLTLVSLPLLWVAGAPSAVFWVIGASFVVVGLHASMYNNERLLEEIASEPTTVAGRNTPAQVHYYNHYPHLAASPQCISLPPSVARATPISSSPSSSSIGHLSQWINFGGGIGGGGSSSNKLDKQQQVNSAAGQSKPVPNVTIISQDFAGLGRVYEV